MSQFNSLRLVGRSSGAQIIANLSDAKTAADRFRAKEVAGEWTAVARLIDDATSGHVSPQVAFDAFAKLAFANGVAVQIEKSAVWEDFANAAGLCRRCGTTANNVEKEHRDRNAN